MKINLIAAIDASGGIGINGQLPWHCPEDLAFFKEKTLGQNILMGRKTFENVGVLPDRKIFVLSKNGIKNTNVVWVKELFDVFKLNLDHIWICGGASLYEVNWFILTCFLAGHPSFAPVDVNHFYITKMYKNYNCDTYAPTLLEFCSWREFKVIKKFNCGEVYSNFY